MHETKPIRLFRACREHDVPYQSAQTAIRSGDLEVTRDGKRVFVDPFDFQTWVNRPTHPREDAYAELHGLGYSIEDIADRYDIKPRSVRRALERHAERTGATT